MSNSSPLSGLVIRTAVVRLPDVGYIIACDPQKEEKDIPHAITFRWNAGAFTQGDRNYNAHTACIVESPEAGLVDASERGYYSITTRGGMTSGDILESGGSPPLAPRTGGIRSVSQVGTQAYAVGYGGMVYRLDGVRTWKRIDDGLPDHLKLETIHGFDASDLYAVGLHGEVWQFNGTGWTKRELPTNGNLNAVKCAGNGVVYIGGYGGILVRGRGEIWDVVDHQETEDHIWDIEWFEGELYLSTMHGVYRLVGEELVPVDFGKNRPRSCYQLSSAKGVMWSNGEYDIMSFDGRRWSRVV